MTSDDGLWLLTVLYVNGGKNLLVGNYDVLKEALDQWSRFLDTGESVGRSLTIHCLEDRADRAPIEAVVDLEEVCFMSLKLEYPRG